MKINKKLTNAVALCVLGMSSFQSGGTVSAAELVVNGELGSLTDAWLHIDGSVDYVYHETDKSGNRLIFDGQGKAVYDKNIYGGHDDADASSVDISGNTVAISRAFIDEIDIVGGSYTVEDKDYSKSGNVLDNSIFISGVDFIGENANNNLYGGITQCGKSENNIVTILKSEGYVRNIYGGWSYRKGNVCKNIVLIADSNLKVKNNICGGFSGDEIGDVIVSDNAVFIGGRTGIELCKNSLTGGYSEMGSANNNTVEIYEGSNIKGTFLLAGGYAGKDNQENNSYSGKDANGNRVTINGSTVESDFSGDAYFSTIAGGYSENGSANNNTIEINNSTVSGYVIGGFSRNDSASDNTIVVSNNSDISKAHVWGSDGEAGSNSNTLILDGWSGSVSSVAGFDKYEFRNIKEIGQAQLITQGENNVWDINNNTEFYVSFDRTVNLQEQSSVLLIEGYADTDNNIDKSITAGIGTSVDVHGNIKNDGNKINFVVDHYTASKQSTVVGSANATAMAFVSDGSELAVAGLAQINSDEYGYNTFAATRGINGDYDNNVDLQGWNNIVGVGHNTKTSAGDFAWGVFYEGGTGEYDTTNSYRDFNFGVDGKAVYNGGGVAARLSHDSGLYYEAGLRAGKLKNDVSNALMDANDIAYGYKTESDYFGYHVGVGKAVALENGNQFDIYARYYHTKVDGDSFVVGSGDRYELDKVYSDRIRLGGRYQDNTNEAVKVYYGAAWEYEFSGESEGSTHGYAMDAADLGGSTLVGEIGLLMNNPGSPWTVDMALQGYTGEREGFGGKVQANYHF